PMPPSFSGPAFQVSKQKRLYAAKLAAYNSAESARVQDAEERATRFRAELATLLATPATVRSTDVWGAIARCSQFHGEPAQGDSSASSQYRNYSLVISDMADNVGAKPVGALPGEFLIVNGAPVLASLNSLHPRRFESVAAAVRYVTGGP
ncbi:MAG TPA: hypothetical protein VK636_13640, partial [Gemmatimonadaceae bacterium]|nr:hypothetical protein [Gemmatimonadaceae bacterium]